MELVLFSIYFVGVVSSMRSVPKYPITASWFKDRFSSQEWVASLQEFQLQGGDTVWLRAQPVVIRSKEDLQRDPSFVWCGSRKSSTGVTGTRCYDEAVQELSQHDLIVRTFLTYNYEENFSNSIMLCPKYDLKIISSRIYYRIVLPLEKVQNPCELPANSSVAVLFTSFAGTDPHELLVETASQMNMSVFFGLPSFPTQSGTGFVTELTEAYHWWIFRVLTEHKQRYNELFMKNSGVSIYDTVKGYYSTDECCLGDVSVDSFYVELYKLIGNTVHSFSKLFTISPYVDLNRSQVNLSVEQHVQGFEILAQCHADVIAVQEGRGAGKGCYYWETEINKTVQEVDPVLDDIIHYIDPKIKPDVTYSEAFTASNQEVFRAFSEVRDRMVHKSGFKFQFWLNVEAFEYIRDDPCLPVDVPGSGMAELLDRTSKERIDRSLTVAGAFTQKIISFAWDSDYVCVSKKYNESLASTIRRDYGRPIISNCSFHSASNMSVVVIGYNLAGLMQKFQVNYPTRNGKRQETELYGYYYETDYGVQHDRVPSLQYVQLFDVPDVYTNLAMKGYVEVLATGSYNKCVFVYDYS
ncbi:hypothetical protein LOTGIDRAFT_154331 [Lottia gigantea]|uniref:DUF4434 domain-containing protein n=1 Tax=Lottia gigantea TaxID=225164 RepID=V4A2S6_LOTGI|nr:hypothetical protein LOTGIDRAFT_154331 [Lottia gigantea]ESO89240.1 hypothetical protein LOTGIDRAFT_154331 [Lottia gigantea]